MRNVRVTGNQLTYDCDAEDCDAPGEPHSCSINFVMAALETTYQQYMHDADPRVEALGIVLQDLYQRHCGGQSGDAAPYGPESPWSKDTHKLMHILSHYYGDLNEAGPSKPKKEFVN